MNWRFSLQEAVLDAHERTGVPGVAAALFVAGESSFAAAGELVLGGGDAVQVDTPFRIASISKPFTATLAAQCCELDDELAALLSHTAGLRCESAELMPESCRGLWSYSNAGYWAAGERAAAACGRSFSDAMRERVLEPLGLGATGYEEPARPARGHVQAGASGHRAVLEDAYAVARRPSGGLWSTVADLVQFGRHHLTSCAELHEPRVDVLGARYALGWWVQELSGGRTRLDHEGSTAGYQSLLMLVPRDELVLAVLTNSWRGSGLVRRIVEALDLAPPPLEPEPVSPSVAGAYALDGMRAVIETSGDSLTVTTSEADTVTGTPIEMRFPAHSIGGGVYGLAGGALQGHRLDFPRPDVARIGWVVLPRVAA